MCFWLGLCGGGGASGLSSGCVREFVSFMSVHCRTGNTGEDSGDTA